MKKSIASRWWPERLRIALCPDRVIVARMAVGWRSRVLGKDVIEFPPSTPERAWQAPLSVLGGVIDAIDAPNTEVSVILSNHFVRYAVVPWRDNVETDPERKALAAHCFKNIYGTVAANWDIRVSDGGFRRNAIASAVDRDLIGELDRSFAERKVSLSSVQPYFMSVCNTFHKKLTAGTSGCLAVLERGRAAIGIFDHSGWQSLTVRRVADNEPAGLATCLAQEFSSANVAVSFEYVFVACPENPKLESSSHGPMMRTLKLTARRGFSPLEDARFAMALCGVG